MARRRHFASERRREPRYMMEERDMLERRREPRYMREEEREYGRQYPMREYDQDEVRFTYGRREHEIGEHKYAGGSYGAPMHDHPDEGPRGFESRERMGQPFKAYMDLNERMRIMQTNNGNMGPVREDFSKPCGLPYGAISHDLGNGDYYSMNAYRVGDLYEQVDAAMRQDADGIHSMTKPTNW